MALGTWRGTATGTGQQQPLTLSTPVYYSDDGFFLVGGVWACEADALKI